MLLTTAGKRVAFNRNISFSGYTGLLTAVLLNSIQVASAGDAAARRSDAVQQQDNRDSNGAEALDELDRVVVVGERSIDDQSVIAAWMRRLVGPFRIEGAVTSVGEASGQKFQGQGLCSGFNPTPAVHCEIRLQNSGAGVFKRDMPVDLSSLSSATIIYGLELGAPRVRYMLVDRNGIADPQLGALSGDTLTSRAPCVGVLEGCQKITRITAKPDGSSVDMQVEVEAGGFLVMTYSLLMIRVSAHQ